MPSTSRAIVHIVLALEAFCTINSQNPFLRPQRENEISRYSVAFSPGRNRPHPPQPSPITTTTAATTTTLKATLKNTPPKFIHSGNGVPQTGNYHPSPPVSGETPTFVDITYGVPLIPSTLTGYHTPSKVPPTTTTRASPGLVYYKPLATTAKPIPVTTTKTKQVHSPPKSTSSPWDVYGSPLAPVWPEPKDYESFEAPQAPPINPDPVPYVGHAPDTYAGYYYYYYPVEVSKPSTTTTTTTTTTPTTTTTTKKPLVAFLTSPNVIGFGVIVLLFVVFAPGIVDRLNQGRALVSSGEWLWLGREIEDKLDQLINISPPDFAVDQVCLQSLQCHWQTLSWLHIPGKADWQEVDQQLPISTCGDIMKQCFL